MFDLLTSDSVIFFVSTVGLAVTTVSIVRDARTQRAERAAEELDPQFVS